MLHKTDFLYNYNKLLVYAHLRILPKSKNKQKILFNSFKYYIFKVRKSVNHVRYAVISKNKRVIFTIYFCLQIQVV